MILTRKLIGSIDSYNEIRFLPHTEDIGSMINKALMLGVGVEKIEDKRGILIGNTIVSEEAIELDSFNGVGIFEHTHFKSIDLTGVDVTKTDSLRRLFTYCHATEINLGDIDTSNIENMDCMFCALTNKVRVDLRKLNTCVVRDMSNMFCSSEFEVLDLSSFDTSKVETMRAMFEATRYENTLDLRGFNTEALIDAHGMFNQAKIKEIDIRGFKTSNLKDVSHMFFYTKTERVLMEQLEFNEGTNTYNVYRGCKQLE